MKSESMCKSVFTFRRKHADTERKLRWFIDYVLKKGHTCVVVLSKMAEDVQSGRRIVEYIIQ